MSGSARVEILRRDGYRCVDCGRWFGDRIGELQVDEVWERTDGGPRHPGNQETRCRACHQRKTNRSRARRHGRGRLRRGWLEPWRLAVGVTCFAVADWWPVLRWRPWELTGLAVVVWVLSVAWFMLNGRRRWRRHMVQALTRGLGKEHMRRPSDRVIRVAVWDGKWRWPVPVDFTVTPGPMAPVTDPRWLDRIAGTASQVTGRKVQARVEGRQVHCTLTRAGAAEEQTVQDRLPWLLEGLGKYVGKPVQVTARAEDKAGHMTGFALALPGEFRADLDDARAAFCSIVNSKLGGRWRASWDTTTGVVVFQERPPMPPLIPRPPVDGTRSRLNLGVDEHGQVVAWDLSKAAHALVIGATGSGKTVTIRCLIEEACDRGLDVRLADPKQLELHGYTGHPGVTAVATEADDMIALVDAVHTEMRNRNRTLRDHPEEEDRLQPILLVIDELREFLEIVNAAHRQAAKRTTGEHPVVEQWRSITRLGRRARVHVLVGIQRPDSKVVGGEARDNYTFRAACGPISPEAARMVFGDGSVGRDLPSAARGRMTVDTGQGPAEVQGFWVEDPARSGNTPPEKMQSATDGILSKVNTPPTTEGTA